MRISCDENAIKGILYRIYIISKGGTSVAGRVEVMESPEFPFW